MCNYGETFNSWPLQLLGRLVLYLSTIVGATLRGLALTQLVGVTRLWIVKPQNTIRICVL